MFQTHHTTTFSQETESPNINFLHLKFILVKTCVISRSSNRNLIYHAKLRAEYSFLYLHMLIFDKYLPGKENT